MINFPKKISYTKKRENAEFEFRNAILDQPTFFKIVPGKIMKPEEWRVLGIQSSWDGDTIGISSLCRT